MALHRTKIAPKRYITGVRVITREDLPRLMQPRDKTVSTPLRLRNSHHTVARLLALGLKLKVIAERTGYHYNRVATLSKSPAMMELVAQYKAELDAAFAEQADAYYELATQNMVAAERHIADRIAELDDAGELMSIREALAVSRDAADRFGYGKKQTNLNVNADFAALLEKAIQRSGKQIEGVVASSPALLHPTGPQPALPGPSGQLEPEQTQAQTLSIVPLRSSDPTPAPAPAPFIRRIA